MLGVRTAVGGSIGCWQVGTSLPGLGFEALPAALAVLAGGVVLTLALEVPVLQQALGGMEVTLTPADKETQTRSVSDVGSVGWNHTPVMFDLHQISFGSKLKK